MFSLFYFGRRHVRPRKPLGNKGFSLVEALIGSVLFFAIAVPIYASFARIFDAIEVSRIKLLATALANEQIEIARNLPYSDVGISGGLPSGKLPATQSLVRSGHRFTVALTARNIDDPFDGTIGGTPNDLSPADYKMLEAVISCATCKSVQPMTFSARIAAKGLETSSNNGALFVHVIDANGQAVVGAKVDILNAVPDPDLAITDVTDASGWLKIIDAPPANAAYEVTVSKSGYTGDHTYAPGAPGNPNPVVPHATVVQQQVTQVTLVIDRVSTVNVKSVNDSCAARGDIDFGLTGSKVVGTNPDVLKYSQSLVTSGAGLLTLPAVEWDIYGVSLADAGYDLAGTIPLVPLDVLPASAVDLSLVVAPKSAKSLLVSVRNGVNQLPISDATVTLTYSGTDTSLQTGSGYRRQTDWSGGAGQNDFSDPTKYFDADATVEKSFPAGEVKLLDTGAGIHAASGTLTSSTFDLGTASNFRRIFWEPQDQPVQAGSDPVQAQIATNNDNATWNFTGPDGTPGSYFTVNSSNIGTSHDGDRYLRYKLFLSTADTAFTPNVADIMFTFTSACVPPGQAFFSGLPHSNYDLSVTAAGYQPYASAINLPSAWQKQDIEMQVQ